MIQTLHFWTLQLPAIWTVDIAAASYLDCRHCSCQLSGLQTLQLPAIWTVDIAAASYLDCRHCSCQLSGVWTVDIAAASYLDCRHYIDSINLLNSTKVLICVHLLFSLMMFSSGLAGQGLYCSLYLVCFFITSAIQVDFEVSVLGFSY